MSEAERSAFEKDLEKDVELAREVRLHREIAEAVLETDIVDLSGELRSIARKSAAEMQGAPRALFSRRWAALAAALALLLAAGWRVFRSSQAPPDPAALFAAYVDLPDVLERPILIRSTEEALAAPKSTPDEESGLENWLELAAAYEAGQYEAALLALERFRTLDPDFDRTYANTYHYYLGLLRLRLAQPEAAAQSFAQVNAGDYAEDAAWKRAMALLLVDGRLEEAKAALRRIQDAVHPRKEDARRVLERLGAM
jgi:tetratricopeptide (TPR) repeat protein